MVAGAGRERFDEGFGRFKDVLRLGQVFLILGQLIKAQEVLAVDGVARRLGPIVELALAD